MAIDKKPIQDMPNKAFGDKHFASEFNTVKQFLLDTADAVNEIPAMIESDFKGIISPSDPTPTEDGTYKPSVSSADPGTNYPNAGNLKAREGYSTFFYKKGSVWTFSETKLPGVNVAPEFDITNDTEAQAAKQIYGGIFGQNPVTTVYIENDIANTDTPINIGASTDAILTIIDSGRTATKTVSKFNFNGTSGLVRLIKYNKSGNTVTLVEYQDVTLNGSVVGVTPTTAMSTLSPTEFWGIRMTSPGNGLSGRIGFEAGTTPTYDCYSNVVNSGNLPDSFDLGSPIDGYRVGFNFEVYDGGYSSIFNEKFDERYNTKSISSKINGKKINILGDSISTTNGGGNANLPTDKQYYGLMKTRDACTIYVNAVAGSSIVTGGQSDTVDFTNDARIASMTTGTPDIILIFGGINDFLQDLPVGTLGDTSKTASFYGALDYLYKNLLGQNPNARIFHMLPLHTTFSQGGGLIPEYNGQNFLTDYLEAIYKVANRYGVGIIDTNKLTGITCYNIATFADDLLHVKVAGHELIYKAVVNELNRML